ncbi:MULTISPECIES: phosphotransferase enzyme family protein [unclassified Brachybacterium]|uniref:phosphotransferase enzyme family protein n=1 Tax=unclassified Brachybacterium TaxID=2623841 RepID=UPI003621EC5C
MSDLTTPTVEMLWERASPHDVLRDRFGFSDAQAASEWITETVRAVWGIDASDCTRIVMSDKNALAWLSSSSGSLVAKWSIAREKFERLDALSRIVSALADDDIPVSAPVVALDGRLQVEVDGVSLALQRKVPGQILDVDDPAQVYASGAVLGRLHHALAQAPDAGGVLASPEGVPSLSERIEAWLHGDRAHLPPQAIRTLRDALPDRGDDRPAQLLHGDFRSTNVLWSDGRISAVLDFDEARVDDRLDELARSAVLLGTKFTEWEPVTPDVRGEFLRGYESTNSLTDSELRWWRALVLWYTLAMVPISDTSSSWSHAAVEELSAPHWTGRRP